MHLAFPTRRLSNPPAYKHTSLSTLLRNKRLLRYIGALCAVGALYFLFSEFIRGLNVEHVVTTTPVVIVTVLDDGATKSYLQIIRENRGEYAKKHGYTTFFPMASDYDLGKAPISWARVPAMRHAMTKYPGSTYVWCLHQDSLIMRPELSVEKHIMDSKRLEDMMIRNQSIVPPIGIVRTYSHLKGDDVDLVVTQDKDGLSQDTLILRIGAWSRFFLDTWFDPLYREYDFDKAESHALEHIVQWHATILAKLAIVPQRIMNAYSTGAQASSLYQDGDFIVRLKGCEENTTTCLQQQAIELLKHPVDLQSDMIQEREKVLQDAAEM